jgi:hypothetical protein
VLDISMSTPAVIARRAASILVGAMPWFINSITPVQSLTTSPRKPQRRRSTSSSSQSLACAGVPPISLNDAITVTAPARMPASYGGR